MAETAKTTMSAIGDARRTQIVQAARTICLEKGFSKITISDIAEHVGMTRSLFYHYFQDRNQVADAVLDDVINEVIAHCGVDVKDIAAMGITNQRETGIVWDKAAKVYKYADK